MTPTELLKRAFLGVAVVDAKKKLKFDLLIDPSTVSTVSRRLLTSRSQWLQSSGQQHHNRMTRRLTIKYGYGVQPYYSTNKYYIPHTTIHWARQIKDLLHLQKKKRMERTQEAFFDFF